jgi:hypothetical protein
MSALKMSVTLVCVKTIFFGVGVRHLYELSREFAVYVRIAIFCAEFADTSVRSVLTLHCPSRL